MKMPTATEEFIRELGRRGATEVELYEQLGFPEGFLETDSAVQIVGFTGEGDCQAQLLGGVVLGHCHDPRPDVEWDGVQRPTSLRKYQRRVQELAPLVRRESPLGQAMAALDRGEEIELDHGGWRAVWFWALAQTTLHRDFTARLSHWLSAFGEDRQLRLAAELVSPSFARRVLVAAHHWPPSERAISLEAFDAAVREDWPNRHHLVCLTTEEDLGELSSIRHVPRLRLEQECTLFPEAGRATSCTLGWVEEESQRPYNLTGDGLVFRKLGGAWELCGPADTVLVHTLEPVTELFGEVLEVFAAEHPELPLDKVRRGAAELDFDTAFGELVDEIEDRHVTLSEKSRAAFLRAGTAAHGRYSPGAKRILGEEDSS